jgi:hypothetical protein
MRPRSTAVVALAACLAWVPLAGADIVPINDPSFEQQVGELPNPLINPPLSGTIGGWNLQRSATGAISGLTVPRIGIVASPAATDGSNVARILFIANVAAAGRFTQTLSSGLEPHRRYIFAVDFGTTDGATVLAETHVRLFAGETMVASSDNASQVRVVDLDGSLNTLELRFCTDGTPPAGDLRIELGARSELAIASTVAFDNVRLRSLPPCPCDINNDCVLNSQDFFDFLGLFFARDPGSDFNGDALLNSQDFFDYLNCFFGGLESCAG